MLGDVDNDGDLDFVVAGSLSSDQYSNGPNTLKLFLNTTLDGTPLTVTVPVVPGQFEISGLRITLNWQDNANNEDHYKVYMNSVNDFAGAALLATLPPNSTTYFLSNVDFNQDYYFWVEAVNSAGEVVSPVIAIYKTAGETIVETNTVTVTAEPSAAELNYTGIGLASVRRYKEAGAYFRKALELNPKSCALLNNMGNALFLMGEYEKAAGFFSKVIEIGKEIPEIYVNLAVAYYKMRKTKEAYSFYVKALDLAKRTESYLLKKLPEKIEEIVIGYFPFWLEDKPGETILIK